MKALLGILLFLGVLILCALFAGPLHQKRIEHDLGNKVSAILTKHGLDSSKVEITKHNLTGIGDLPTNPDAVKKLRDDLDGVIGLYLDLDLEPAAELAPPHFRLAEQADQSVILTGLVRDDNERKFLVGLASTPTTKDGAPRTVIDKLELSDDVAPITSEEKLTELTPRFLNSAEQASLDWSPSSLVLAGIVDNKNQQATLLAAASASSPEGIELVDELTIQPYQHANFGLKRKDDTIVVTGLLPDTETRDELLAFVKSGAKGARVIDRTTLANRLHKRWWAHQPKAFIPDFLSTTKGPARLHYHHDRFIAESVFEEKGAHDNIVAKIAKLPESAERLTKLVIIEKPAPAPIPQPNPVPTPAPTPTPEPVPAIATNLVNELKLLAVYFDSSSATVKTAEDQKIKKAAQLILSAKDVPQGLTVGGFADIKGNADFNRKLSLRRANTVRDRLIALGVSGDRLTVNHFGEDTSKTAQADLWKSRRVEISLTKSSD